MEELTRLVSAVAFTVAIGNADAHAKNLSLLHDTATTIRLAPLYDTVPTVLWPTLTEESAMSINGRFALGDVTLADIADEAASWPVDRDTAEKVAADTLETTKTAAARLTSERLAEIVGARCDALLDGRPAGGR